MKMKLLCGLLLFSIISNAQTNTRTELTNEEIQYLATDITYLTKPVNVDFEKSLKNNLIIYEFEIQYHNEPIYRGAINKPCVSKIGAQIYRRKVAFCIDYNLLDTDTKLELTEKKQLQLTETEKGNKYFWTDNYELFSYDSRSQKLAINKKLSKNIEIKFYKTTN